jgi:hypothetical protein
VGLGATYRDTAGRLYGTRVGNDRNVTALLRARKRPAELKGLTEPSPDAPVIAHWRAAPEDSRGGVVLERAVLRALEPGNGRSHPFQC